ncbi:hypothetical protein DXA13_15870 [Clostridium sp. AM58-1XD]|nr:hypothetical protein DXA13_15870 [Clostridium sp. AM58-1XD]
MCLSVPVFTSCSAEKKQAYFNAEILEIKDRYLLVEPAEGEEELKSSDRIEVPTDAVSKEGIPENLKAGDRIRIVYSGEIQEMYPAGLVTVYAIYMASEVE